MKKNYRLNLLFLISSIFLSSFILLAQVKEENAKPLIYAQFRLAIVDSLKAKLKDSTEIGEVDVWKIATTAVQEKGKELKSEAKWIGDNQYESIVNDMEKNLIQLIKNADKPLEYDSKFSSKEEAINNYLVDLFQESIAFKQTGEIGINPLSDYRFLLGGSWVHTDSAAAEGIFTASFFFRTRLFDSRGDIHNKVNLQKREKRFLDLFVDAQFIGNESFNKIARTNPLQDDSAKTVLLESVKSSKISMGLYWVPFKSFFHDKGVIGLLGRYNISTQEGSSDIFRRLILGLRLENRSPELRIFGASAEVGITANNAAGSLQNNDVFAPDRVVLNFELPITNTMTRRGLYVQFHGEWPVGDKEKIKLEDTGEEKEIAPPMYQFRFGYTFDPINMFGPLFNFGN